MRLLVTCILKSRLSHTLSIGCSFTLLSPTDWIRRPASLFEVVQTYRPTIYYQPNFAFNFMTQRIRDEEMEGLDLSSLRLCCNGAEPCMQPDACEATRLFLANTAESLRLTREKLEGQGDE